MAIKYIAGDRLIGTAAERAAMTTSTSNVTKTGWKILGRYDHENETPPTITAKDNLMLVIFTKRAGSGSTNILLKFNDDASGNYSWRTKNQSGSSTTMTDSEDQSNGIPIHSSGDEECFSVVHIRNKDGREKSIHSRTSASGGSGAGNEQTAGETWGKWDITSGQITKVTVHTTDSTNWQSGSETVILGMDDDEADSGSENALQKLIEVLGEGNNDVDTGTSWTAKKYMFVMFTADQTGAASDGGEFYFNGRETQSEWAYAREINGAGTGQYTSQNRCYASEANGGDQPTFITAWIHNTTREHGVIMNCSFAMGDNNQTPQRGKVDAKWANTSLITSFGFTRAGGERWDAGAELIVWGFD